MHLPSHAVSRIAAHHVEIVCLHIGLHCAADVDDAVSDCGLLNPLIEARLGHIHQLLGLGGDGAHRVRPGAVADEAAVAGADIDADDVALRQDAVFARDAVDQLIVDAGANVRRVAPIAQEGRCRIVLLQNFQRDLVKLPRAHTRDDGLPQRLMDTCHNPARLTHDLNLTRALEDRLGPLLLAPDGATLFLGSTFEYTH